ncbi:MAG: hypothetical protein ACYTEQ_00375 [Planctomycetota bacterium]|jgi:hypothetical protein
MKIEVNGIQDFFENSPSRQLSTSKGLSRNNLDASLRVNYASLIDEAMQVPDTDVNAIQKAQELLLSGRLEGPENIRKAAENIITFGI